MTRRLRILAYSAAIGPVLATIVYAIGHFVGTSAGMAPDNFIGLLLMAPLVAAPVIFIFVPTVFLSYLLTRGLPTVWFCGLFTVLASAGYVLLVLAADRVLAPNNFIISDVRAEDIPAFALHLVGCLAFTVVAFGLEFSGTPLFNSVQTKVRTKQDRS